MSGCNQHGHDDNCPHLAGEVGDVELTVATDSMMPASAEVAALVGDPDAAGMNYFNTGGNCYVVCVQVDDRVFIVGQDDYEPAEMAVDQWNSTATEDEDPVIHEADTAKAAVDFLTARMAGTTIHRCPTCAQVVHTATPNPGHPIACSGCTGTAVGG